MVKKTTLCEVQRRCCRLVSKMSKRFKKSILDHLTPIVGSSADVSVAVTVDVADAATETNKMTYDPRFTSNGIRRT